MGLSYSQLDEVTRHLMLEEVDKDEREGKLYVSDRLSQTGVHDYPELLRNAIRSGTDVTLAGALNQNGRPTRQNNVANLVADSQRPECR